MKLDDRSRPSDAQLVGYSVMDRHGYLLGQVVGTQARSENDWAIVVHFPASKSEMADFIVEDHQVDEINTRDRTIQTQLEFNQVVPVQGKTIDLVSEALKIRRQRHKVGEIVVRKVVETDWVQIPVRREKLIVEEVGQPEPLYEVTLGTTRVQNSAAESISTMPPISQPAAQPIGKWSSFREALAHLNRLANDPDDAHPPIEITLSLVGHTNSPVDLKFPSPQIAAQMLASLSPAWETRCQTIALAKL